MSNSHHSRFLRGACNGIAIVAAVLLQPATLAFATTSDSASGAFKNGEMDARYRRCEWTPKMEHCYWAQGERKIRTH